MSEKKNKQVQGKVSFPFYYNWEEQLQRMNLEERWSFIHNLIKFHTDREITFVSEKEEMAWIGIIPALNINLEKYKAQVERSRENGKKHTGKNIIPPVLKQITQQVILEPTEPDKSEETTGNREMITVNREETTGNREMVIGNEEREENTVDEETNLIEKLNSIDDWKKKLVTNGTGWVIDELIKSFQLSMEDRYGIIKIYDEMTSQRNSE
jgi:hypothetical protein